MKAIILAAGRGKRFGKRTRLAPKCLIPIGKSGQTLLGRYLDSLRKTGVSEVAIVVGHQKNRIISFCQKYPHGLKIRFIVNPRFRRGSIVSLFCALKRHAGQPLLIMDADVYFSTESLQKLMRSSAKTAFLIDHRSKSSGEEMMLMAKNSRPWAIAKTIDPRLKIVGEATGIFKISRAHTALLSQILKTLIAQGVVDAEYEESYQALMQKVRVGFVDIGDVFWSEMDFESDLRKILKNQ